jgi:superfamily II DNA helicase RecQ
LAKHFWLKIVIIYKHCITTLGRISGFAMEGLVCQEVCFQVHVPILALTATASTQRKKEIASTQRKKLHQQNKEYSVIDK